MKSPKIIFSFVIILALAFGSCSDDDTAAVNETNDSFDRQAMLVNWADNIIIPSYQSYVVETAALKQASDAFETAPNTENLAVLRQEWEDAYIAWQNVSLFNIGPAQNTFIRRFTNIYPTNAVNIEANIASGEYALQDINRDDEQGFPALDYLLFGLADSEDEILSFYTSNSNAANYISYLSDVVDRINTLANEVATGWEGDYRGTFVDNSGNSANSSTNVLVNEYMRYYEVFFRNGKIGTPAGVFSSGNEQPDRVEAFYKKDLSKRLSLEALGALQGFFRGKAFNGAATKESLEDYLIFLNSMKSGDDLAGMINNQFMNSERAISALDDNFYQQINTNNASMLEAFETLQRNVVLLKSDMMSALSINIAFESNDGD